MCSNTSARISASIRLDQIEMPGGPACESIVRRACVRHANASTDGRALACVVSRTRTVRVVPGAAGRIRRDRMTDREAACGYVVLCVMCVRAGEIPTRPHGMHPSSYARVKLPRAGRPPAGTHLSTCQLDPARSKGHHEPCLLLASRSRLGTSQ